MLTIHGAGTSRTLRAHWMATELGLSYESKMFGSRSGATQETAFRALSIKEKVPVLTDGDFVLTESAAIVTYLGDTYGPTTGLVPAPMTRARAQYNEWLSFVQMELDAHTLYILRKHQDLTDLYGEAPAAVAHAIEGFGKQVQWASNYLERNEYLVGDAFTGADILLCTCADWALAYNVGIPDAVNAHRERCRERPAFGQAARHNFSIKPDERADGVS